MLVILKGSASSGWFAPPKGTHTGEKHRAIGSGKAKIAIERVGGTYSGIGINKVGVDVMRMKRRGGSWEEAGSGDPSTESAAKKLGISREEVVELAMDRLNDATSGPIATRMSLDAMNGMLDDGRMRNVHEVDTSAMLFVMPDVRRQVEETYFDIPLGSDPQAYPLYGYAVNAGTKQQRSYGAIEVYMNDNIKDRSTVTVGDTYELMATARVGLYSNKHQWFQVAPSPYNAPSVDSLGKQTGNMAKGRMDLVDYVEVQIHGGVAIADVSKVVLHTYGQDKAAMTTLERRLVDAGVVVEIDKGR